MKAKNRVINIMCIICKQEFHIQVNDEDYEKFKQGALAEDVMPYLTDDEVSVLTCGLCEQCL